MASQEDDEVLLQRIAAAARGGAGRSPLYRWMWQHYDQLKDLLDRPDWAAVAREFADAGKTAARGKPLTATTVRQTWWKVKRDKDATLSATPGKRGKAQPLAVDPAVQVVGPEPEPEAEAPDGRFGRGVTPKGWVPRREDE